MHIHLKNVCILSCLDSSACIGYEATFRFVSMSLHWIRRITIRCWWSETKIWFFLTPNNACRGDHDHDTINYQFYMCERDRCTIPINNYLPGFTTAPPFTKFPKKIKINSTSISIGFWEKHFWITDNSIRWGTKRHHLKWIQWISRVE